MKQDIFLYDDYYTQVNENYLINPEQNLTVSNYLYGRCHLFALVYAESTNSNIGLFLEEDTPLDYPAIEHAFIYHSSDPETIIDARGTNNKKELFEVYCSDTFEFFELSNGKELILEMINKGFLEDFYKKEKYYLEKYIENFLENKLNTITNKENNIKINKLKIK